MHPNHSREIQQEILNSGDRDRIIGWLVWNDSNGCYTDDDSESEGGEPLTLEGAKELMELALVDSQESTEPKAFTTPAILDAVHAFLLEQASDWEDVGDDEKAQTFYDHATMLRRVKSPRGWGSVEA